MAATAVRARCPQREAVPEYVSITSLSLSLKPRAVSRARTARALSMIFHLTTHRMSTMLLAPFLGRLL
eukprot:3083091-Pyramimonas_sp.AAC.1